MKERARLSWCWRCRILYSSRQIAYTMRFLEFVNQTGIKEMRIRPIGVFVPRTPATEASELKRAEKKSCSQTQTAEELPKILCATREQGGFGDT